MLTRLSFGLEPFSNVWQAVWTTLAFAGSLTVWVLAYTGGRPDRDTSYVEDFVALSPIATIIFALLAVVLWIVWWRGRSG